MFVKKEALIVRYKLATGDGAATRLARAMGPRSGDPGKTGQAEASL